MNPMVEEYLEKKKKQDAKSALASDEAYRKAVLTAAGLVEKAKIEINDDEYFEISKEQQGGIEEDAKGLKHYYRIIDKPIEITDEEFDAVEKSFSPEELESFKDVSEEVESSPSSWAAGFCNGIALLSFIGGLIAAIIIGATGNNGFSFSSFLTVLGVCILAGCFALCMSEHFVQLNRLVNLLEEK